MNAPAQKPDPIVIVIPPTTVALLAQLAERMARVTGESVGDVRRGVELSVLSRGCAAVQAEIAEAENQAERMGWPR